MPNNIASQSTNLHNGNKSTKNTEDSAKLLDRIEASSEHAAQALGAKAQHVQEQVKSRVLELPRFGGHIRLLVSA